MSKIGRNQICPFCNSGRKYKHCHGAHKPEPLLGAPWTMPSRQKAAEHIRQNQQGKGRPIIAFKTARHQIVAVGNNIYWSGKWKTFPDFLMDYMKGKLGPEWIKPELEKPPEK